MTDARTEARWDHDRDLRKHDSPSRSTMPPLPARLQPVVPAAMEVAIAVKALDNYTEAANLIELYAQSVVPAARLDKAVSA